MKAVVDKIDSGYARVLFGEDAVAISVALSDLPPRAHEGMGLHVRFNVDPTATVGKERKSAHAE